MDFADIRLVTGDQGSGKSMTGTALAADDYHRHIDRIISPQGKVVPTLSFSANRSVWKQLGGNPLSNVILSYNGKPPILVNIDKLRYSYNCEVYSPIRIFANYHLFGMKYAHMRLAKLIEYMNSDLLTNGWILWDESTELDARDSMTLAGKIEAWFGASIRKRQLHYVSMSQLESQIEKRYRAFATTRILCEYDKKRYVTCTIRTKGEQKKEITYDSWPYRKFYRTDERLPIPEAKIARALMHAR